MLQELQTYLQREDLFHPSQRLLLAVSGGLDSVVLTHLSAAAGLNTGIAHCNFRLRDEESLRDEQFVRQLAARYDVPFYTVQFDTAARAQQHRQSIQVAARELRYLWLEKIRQQEGYDYIATAHHMQDNVETLWMNISKGTGIAGLHGILPKQGRVVRPLLFATREEISSYAAANNLAHVEDSSNATDKYTRNFFRHRVLPLLEEAYPQVVKNTGAGIQRFREAEMLYHQAVEVHRRKLLERRKQEYFIPVLKLKQVQPLHTILYELLKPFQCTAAQAAQVADLLHSEPGKWVATPAYRIVRDRKWLLITPLEPAASEHFIIEDGQELVQLPDAQLVIKTGDPAAISQEPHIADIDRQALRFPLLLRRWKQGDYFYPLGMKKKKKLSRFFIDQKLSLPEKEKVWVLESHKKIVWVAGMRIDDRFRITPATKTSLRITLKNT